MEYSNDVGRPDLKKMRSLCPRSGETEEGLCVDLDKRDASAAGADCRNSCTVNVYGEEMRWKYIFGTTGSD